jgi:hypothetical protein
MGVSKMKKRLVSSAILCMAVLSLAACGPLTATVDTTPLPETTMGGLSNIEPPIVTTTYSEQPAKSPIDWDGLEVLNRVSDHIGWATLPEIMENVELIIEGEIIDEMAERIISGWTTDNYGYPIPTTGASYAKLKITRVFKGDKKVGDVITLGLAYFIAEADENGREIDYPRLISSSELTPMKNGERWFFFLDTFETFLTEEARDARREQEHVYWPQGDIHGRFPIPDAEKLLFIDRYNEIKEGELEYFDAIGTPALPVLSAEDIMEYERQIEAGEISGHLISHNGKDSSWGIYLVSDDQFYALMSFWQELDNLYYSLDPAEYGVYEMGYFSLDLYADVCNEFYR